MANLPAPPKFQGPQAPAPQSADDWQSLFRWFTTVKGAAGQSWGVQGTHALRLTTAATPDGTTFYESDRTVFYVAVAGAWKYGAGIMAATQATLPTDLEVSDVGFLARVTDYAHLLEWSGTAWSWGPGDEGSGKMELREIDPPAVGWHLYDGSTVSYLKSDGTLGGVTLPNLVDSFLVAGPVNSGPNPAAAPTISGGAIAAAETGITNPAATGSGNAALGADDTSKTFDVPATGTSTTVAADPHSHTDAGHTHTIGAPTDPGHTHAISPIVAGADGAPANLVRRAWFRQ